eukprot:3332993-Rhodomonas_salina.1
MEGLVCRFGDVVTEGALEGSRAGVCAAPAHTEGRVSFTLSTDGGTSFVETGLEFEYVGRAAVER